jgi:hypothetical protein
MELESSGSAEMTKVVSLRPVEPGCDELSQENRHLALRIAALLPNEPRDAALVLEMARKIVAEYFTQPT